MAESRAADLKQVIDAFTLLVQADSACKAVEPILSSILAVGEKIAITGTPYVAEKQKDGSILIHKTKVPSTLEDLLK